ncbi:MAG: prephenate/arogenate dehydrogenase [Oscillatoriales cyanobacterium SM2_1_8]|nr:prephenate/arogenate dehydrogenase [Oscillatoriales cyanobacterium SM2_1_8]
MNIGILGLGLIGGSLGYDLVNRNHYVWGTSRNPDTCRQAVDRGAACVAHPDWQAIPGSDRADVVVLCGPIATILPTLQAIAPCLSPDTVVTDVASVKSCLCQEAAALHPRFVGGHPMAGGSGQGLAAAVPDLFRDRPWVLTPLPSADRAAVTLLQTLWESLGAKVWELAPAAHDRAVARISHGPVFVSASALVPPHGHETQLASSGFFDTTRIGGGNPQLGRLMAQYNREAVLVTLQENAARLAWAIAAIEQERWDDLEAWLQEAARLRQTYFPT